MSHSALCVKRLLGVLLLSVVATAAQAATLRDANLLFIWIDDLGTQRLDYPEAKLPNLDLLAERGVTFTRAYAPSPLCSPSRGAVLSGLPNHVSGHSTNLNKTLFRNIPAYRDVLSWPEDLRKNYGRRTFVSGKIFHGKADPESFDEFGPDFGGPEARGKVIERSATRFNTSFSEQPREETNDFLAAAFAADVVGRAHAQPFVMMVGLRRPHRPFYVPEQYRLWELDEIGVPAGYIDGDRADTRGGLGRRAAGFKRDQKRGVWPNLIRGYLAASAFADDAAGLVLDALASGPNANNTIVIAAGDHGFCLGEKDHVAKAVMWDCGSRTELIISAPGMPAAGARVDNVVSLMDLQPTVRELMGLAPRDDIYGQSLYPLLTGNGDGFRGFSIMTYKRKNWALRTDDYTLIRYRSERMEEFYDHASDPYEHTNLLRVTAEPEGHADMQAALERLLDGEPTPF
ncbi:MAG: sulfatase-like hydrolase/transferase [Pseudomonadota bacterium]